MADISKENRISADSHMAEPLDLWQTRMPVKFKEHALSFTGHKIGEGQYAREGGWEPVPRLKDMAADGVNSMRCGWVLPGMVEPPRFALARGTVRHGPSSRCQAGGGSSSCTI